MWVLNIVYSEQKRVFLQSYDDDRISNLSSASAFERNTRRAMMQVLTAI